MHKLRRFFYQNKYQILGVLGVIFFIFIVIQLINFWARKSNDNKVSNINANTTVVNENTTGVISEKSAVTGKEISKKELQSETSIINNFIEYCNKQDIENAYNLLTEECKKQVYNNSIDVFKQSYYKDVFNGEKKNCTIENWVNDTYRVNITGDVLATGKVDEYSKQDYITVKEIDGDYKLNINNYIGYFEINKKTTENDSTIEVIGKNTYKDYEEYTMNVTNNTKKMMQLDNISNTESLYIEDSKGVKYPYYNHELTTPMLTVAVGQTKEVTIKFYSSYVSTKNIKHIVFSNIMLKNGQMGDVVKFEANV